MTGTKVEVVGSNIFDPPARRTAPWWRWVLHEMVCKGSRDCGTVLITVDCAGRRHARCLAKCSTKYSTKCHVKCYAKYYIKCYMKCHAKYYMKYHAKCHAKCFMRCLTTCFYIDLDILLILTELMLSIVGYRNRRNR